MEAARREKGAFLAIGEAATESAGAGQELVHRVRDRGGEGEDWNYLLQT